MPSPSSSFAMVSLSCSVKSDAVHLCAVAQRGVEQIEPFLAHAAPCVAASVLSMVVLASHSPPRSTVLRCCAEKPRFLKKSCALSLTSAVSALRHAPG
jgi:hypothetical protein